MAISGAVSYASTLDRLASQLLGIPGSFLPIFIIVFGLSWCMYVIHVKTMEESNSRITLPIEDKSQLRYKYGQPVRYLAKAGLLILLVLLPGKLSTAIDEVVPLPPTFYGYLIDARSAKPMADVRVRVVTADGVDITKGVWLSDSEGFYIVETLQRVQRNAHLVVIQPDCNMEQSLSLRRVDESHIDAFGRNTPAELRPMFRHIINCGGGK